MKSVVRRLLLDLLHRGVLVLQAGPVFLSRLSVVPKENSNEPRLVVDLSHLNAFIDSRTFRMLTVAQVRLVLHSGDWMFSLVLENAYRHVSLLPCFRKFLAVQVDVLVLQFTVMPFALNIAPGVFTKLTSVVASRLAQKGSYIPDVPRRLAAPRSFQVPATPVPGLHTSRLPTDGVLVHLP